VTGKDMNTAIILKVPNSYGFIRATCGEVSVCEFNHVPNSVCVATKSLEQLPFLVLIFPDLYLRIITCRGKPRIIKEENNPINTFLMRCQYAIMII